MLRLEMLPAAHGDALWLEYGTADATHRVLIDGGPRHTYPALRARMLALPPADRVFELLVITHIDADHIDGIIRLLQDTDLGCTFGEIWFNGWPQIRSEADVLGAKEGEYLGALIEELEERQGAELWNTTYDRQAVKIGDTLPTHTLPGGMKLTILGPSTLRLADLQATWAETLEKVGAVPGDVEGARARLREVAGFGPLGDVLGGDEDRAPEIDEPLVMEAIDVLGGAGAPGSDTSHANGSSIAVLAEYDGHRLLLAGDAFAPDLEESVDKLLADEGRPQLTITAFKLPHHGSIANITPTLLDKLKCTHYLISTSGRSFGHPDPAAMDLILAHHRGRGKPRLHFNHRSKTTEPWAGETDEYVASFPEGLLLSW